MRYAEDRKPGDSFRCPHGTPLAVLEADCPSCEIADLRTQLQQAIERAERAGEKIVAVERVESALRNAGNPSPDAKIDRLMWADRLAAILHPKEEADA